MLATTLDVTRSGTRSGTQKKTILPHLNKIVRTQRHAVGDRDKRGRWTTVIARDPISSSPLADKQTKGAGLRSRAFACVQHQGQKKKK